ncbi:DUF4229 domain-containing protein [Nocardia puris]|uniref:Uncharacterized protein DUF4229 n=1 Tax=Nocardia puris TaxID=208602 RepID=A0A366DKZ3_9NOCA|nr:DUF4229 domain-containing protein [Nocardia puris]MBF6365118.1 DUF4229 domain-containing protein [Nocardia puris]MBF6458903.1 DUF4229 domain-containing protein [Nocardia puris]RBO90757.1 uncharacterized protein DUF4229 [Nocardia puris]
MDKTDGSATSAGGVREGPATSSHTLVRVSDSTRPEQPTARPGRRLAINLALYTLARLVLVAIITALILGGARLIDVEVPLVVAALFALIIAMPLSLTLFKTLRVKVNEDIALVDERRRRDKAQLRARLRGEDGA